MTNLEIIFTKDIESNIFWKPTNNDPILTFIKFNISSECFFEVVHGAITGMYQQKIVERNHQYLVIFLFGGGREGMVNVRLTLRDSKTSIFLCKPETF